MTGVQPKRVKLHFTPPFLPLSSLMRWMINSLLAWGKSIFRKIEGLIEAGIEDPGSTGKRNASGQLGNQASPILYYEWERTDRENIQNCLNEKNTPSKLDLTSLLSPIFALNGWIL
jgi:hypothetical protein